MKYLIPPIVAVAMLLSGCQTMEVQGVTYHKAAAQYATLGACGSAGIAWGTEEFVPDSSNPTFEQPLQTKLLTVETNKSVRKAAVNVTGNVPKLGAMVAPSAGANIGNENDVNGKYNIISIQDNIPAKINAPANSAIRDSLFTWGSKARFVTTVAIAYKQSQTVKGNVSSSMGATYSAVSGKLALATDTKKVIKLSDGTVFAYEVSRPCWKKDSHGNVMVAAVIPWRPGTVISAPPGTSFDPANIK